LMGAAALVGLLAGLVRDGRLSALSRTHIRFAWLIPLAIPAQLLVIHVAGVDTPWWVAPLHLATYAVLLAVVLANRRLTGMPLLALGLGMNVLAMGANGGLMPVAPEVLAVRHGEVRIAPGQHIPRSKDVLLPREQTRLWWITDCLVSPPWLPLPERLIFSPGDLVIAGGVVLVVQGMMHPLGLRWPIRRRHPVAQL